jgi:hypothetical protein
MKPYLILLAIFATTLRLPAFESVVAPPRLVVSVRPATADPRVKDGYYLFFEDPAPSDAAVRIVAYEYRAGQLQRKYAPGYLEEDYLSVAFAKIEFEAFDYEAEKKRVEQLLTDSQRRGLARHLADTGMEEKADQAYTIEIGLADRPMVFTETAPRHRVAVYALYSQRFKKLKQVLDLVAQTYGHSRLGI